MSFTLPFASLHGMSRTGAFIVTGAGSGIGQAISIHLTNQGHYVFGLGRDLAKLKATTQMAKSGLFKPLSIDLADSAKVASVVYVIREDNKLDGRPLLGIVNSAGIYDYLPFAQSTDEVWERHFQVNLLSAVRLCREFYPDLKASAPSSVLNISSTLGLRPVANTTAYSAIKAGMVNWTQSLALEWASDKIRVNCICPGIIDTPMHATRKLSGDMQPLGRIGTPDDIAKSAVFLLSEDSSWTTGAVLNVDGGINL